jgi:hypothetical protein
MAFTYTNTSGHLVVPYYNWREARLECRCGWTGTSRQTSRDSFAGGVASHCPACDEVIVTAYWPNEAQTREAAARGNEEAMNALSQFD